MPLTQLESMCLYLKPFFNQKPVDEYGCASWLVLNGIFKNVSQAMHYLHKLSYNDPWKYKSLMSDYYMKLEKAMDTKYETSKKPNKYRNSYKQFYGEELHMYH